MKFNTNNRAVEAISSISKSNNRFGFQNNSRNLPIDKSRFDLAQENENYNENSLIYVRNKKHDKDKEMDSFQVNSTEAKDLIKAVDKQGANFVYEDYIVNLICSEHPNINKAYGELTEASFISLPNAVKDIVDEIHTIVEHRKMYVNYNKTYNLLFQKYKLNLAINYFNNCVSNIKISNSKLIRVYSKIEKYKQCDFNKATEEVVAFSNIVKYIKRGDMSE